MDLNTEPQTPRELLVAAAAWALGAHQVSEWESAYNSYAEYGSQNPGPKPENPYMEQHASLVASRVPRVRGVILITETTASPDLRLWMVGWLTKSTNSISIVAGTEVARSDEFASCVWPRVNKPNGLPF